MAICVNANRVERMGNRIIVAKLSVETQGVCQDIYCQSTKGAQIKCSSPKQSTRSMWHIDRFVARLAHFRECHRWSLLAIAPGLVRWRYLRSAIRGPRSDPSAAPCAETLHYIYINRHRWALKARIDTRVLTAASPTPEVSSAMVLSQKYHGIDPDSQVL